MNYYIDTEFLEGKQKERFPINLFRKETPNTIDLISIGIVSEDDREYYAISKDFNLKEAWNRYDLKLPEEMGDEPIKVYWIRENVLKPIWKDYLENRQSMYEKTYHWELTSEFSYKTMKTIINWIGKTNKQIADEIKQFCSPEIKRYNQFGEYTLSEPKFYAYYGDYDWVAFCWLFGKKIDLPNGFPMYCIDLKQECDKIPDQPIQNHVSYPKQTNEHNALADAKWNRELNKFLKSLENN